MGLKLQSSCALALALCFGAGSFAGIPPWYKDKLAQVVNDCENHLNRGEPREAVISNLVAAVAAEPQSKLVPFTKHLIADLRETIERTRQLSLDPETIRRFPERYLAESRISCFELRYIQQVQSLDRLVASSPEDPACLLLKQGQPAIGKLIGCLTDPSVTRTGTGPRVNGDLPQFMKVRELAMHLIEYLSGCDFLLSRHEPEDFERIVPHMTDWWARNETRPREEGIRDELDSAYQAIGEMNHRQKGLIWMARTLALSNNSDQAAHGRAVLEDMLQTKRLIEAAAVLARLGSRAPFAILRSRFEHAGLRAARAFNREELFFLMEFGGREEWQMIRELAELEIETYGQVPDLSDGPNRTGVLGILVEDANWKPLWAVPCIALALDQTQLTSGDQCLAFDAAHLLENVTGRSFGFRADASLEARFQAADKASLWWKNEGQKLYSWSRISALWDKITPNAMDRSPANQVVPGGAYTFHWILKRAKQAPASVVEGSADLTVKVIHYQVTCTDSSNPNWIGRKGSLESEGQGRFAFRLSCDGYRELSHRWLINIDGTFRIQDGEGSGIVEPNTKSSY